MAHDEFLALLIFAGIGSVTPGPNNAVATVTAATFGLRAALPHVVGVPLGFSTMLFAAAAGAASLVADVPALATALHWSGIAYMAWLAFALARDRGGGSDTAGPFALPLGVVQSAAFQFLNPKAWMLALAIAGTWIVGADTWRRAATAGLVFTLTAVLSLLAWAGAGAALRRWLASPRRLRAFNLAMALALALTAGWLAWRGER
ncbi:MAG TPA: LysE family translocator [Burkholderiaceae bacterium]|nr:LysE family translocator [Burkholderiaceae bacterium]